MGTIGLVVITPLIAESCLSNVEEETSNFIYILGLWLKEGSKYQM
jgi:hypothetical protein